MKKEEITGLLNKYKAGKATEEELAFLEHWYAGYSSDKGEAYQLDERVADASEIWTKLPVHQTKIVKIRIWPRIAAAAAILLVFGTGLFFYIQYSNNSGSARHLQLLGQHIKPGGNKAYLTLADGKRISLTDANHGLLAKQAGITITKTASGALVYTIEGDQDKKSTVQYNTIETPKGGQFQIRLPDGTAVWLNASSSLKYPASFATLKERKVELEGEAYFEVFKDKAHPFMIRTKAQEVKVLGTHFNINSYDDEEFVKTTLLEGSVIVAPLGYENGHENMARYGSGIKLKPGQMSSNQGGYIDVKQASLKQVMAWREGYFNFEDENIQSVMRKIARWYDVDVNYEWEIPAERFNGSISRFKNVSEILKMLESTGTVHFKVEGRRITVMK